MNTVSKNDIINGLRRIGLAKGDHVIVHSALSSFGRVRGGAEALIEALLEAVGAEGTVLVPTFGCSDKVFDPARSETGLGMIPQALWKKKGALRSRHPLASVAAIGKKAEWLIKNHENARIAHGKNTPYYRLAQIGGKILFLGVDQDRSTFMHTIEELAELEYLKPAKGKYMDSRGRIKTKTWPYFPGPHRNFIGIQSWLESQGLVAKTRIGNCIAQLMTAGNLLNAISERLKIEPNLFISDNPNLPDGVRQNADLLRAEFKKESFTLAADSQYAGRYFEQITGNLKRFGIDNIVLSYVNNTLWGGIDSRKRKWYLQGLKLAGVRINALRVPVLYPDKALTLLKESKAGILIVPSSSSRDDISRVSAENFAVHVENTALNSAQTKHLMAGLSRGNDKIALAFNPLNFVQAGDNPFLYTYTKARVKRYTGSLFINDGLATGQRTNLEEGLAEIKELISIFRCRSFAGLFILQGPGPGSFVKTAEKFISLLRELGNVPQDN
ncbi:MAG: AAC(3) family N-acetyltransferase [Planctomycetota bacterium]